MNIHPISLLGKKRWPFLALLALLLLLTAGATLSLAVLRAAGDASFLALTTSVSTANAHEGLDPNLLVDPANYDTRPCAAHPSAAICNGRYPVTPPHVPPTQAVGQGAGACIDSASRLVEDQSLTDGNGAVVGDLQLRWLPTCRSYYGYVSFTFPRSQVSRISIWIQSESYGWFQRISLLPPQANQVEQTGPVTGSALFDQGLYSPLLYAPSDNVSAHIDIELANGTTFGNGTSAYAAGILQYSA